MKKLLVILTILVMSVLLLASCDLGGTPDNGGNDDANVNVCPHNNLIEHPETNSTCAKHGKTSGVQCMDCFEFNVRFVEKPSTHGCNSKAAFFPPSQLITRLCGRQFRQIVMRIVRNRDFRFRKRTVFVGSQRQDIRFCRKNGKNRTRQFPLRTG